MRIRCIIAALTFGLALSAAPAQARDRTIVFEVRLVERPTTCDVEHDEFGLAFDMVSLSGAVLGTGQSCVHHTKDGCLEFRPFCRLTRDATFTLDFRRGTVASRMTLREVKPTEGVFLQHGTGRITSGTGAFAGAHGRVEGGGVIEFTPTSIETAVFYAVRLK